MDIDNVSSNDDALVSDKASDDESNVVETGAGDVSSTNSGVNGRVKRRAKRLNRQGSKEGANAQGAVGGPGLVQTTRRWKNSRRPRNGHNRGLPKKG